MRAIGTAILLFVAASPGTYAQTAAVSEASRHSDTLTVADARPFRLRPFVVRGSVSVRLAGSEVDSTAYNIDYRFGQLALRDSLGAADTIFVTYKALPVSFRDVYRATAAVTRSDSVRPGNAGRSTTAHLRPSRAADPFGSSRLQRSGSITRGVIAGNRQDATIESGLRMQLSGEVVDGVELRAVLTDENTPILPEGTTQRINEFDRVFIELRSAGGSAQLGDFELAMTGTEFAQFDRKLQGAKVTGQVPGLAGDVFAGADVTVAGATSRGIFRSQTIEALEGAQGPYRLEGQSGERFIIVVPGTESVFIDGRRLERGETNDYVIDYATAEITFTPRQLITANKRIVVEFQYSTNQFTRSLIGAGVTSRFGRPEGVRAQLSATFIREADSKDFNEEFGLTSADSLLLVNSGDGVASRSGAEPVMYDPEAVFVQYVRRTVDLPDGGVDTAFVSLTSEPPPDETVFRVQFTRVSPGNGRYVRTGRSVNGITYEYRGPGLGDYEPIRILPKPRLQQVFDLAGSVEPVQGVELFGDLARSVNNLNRLSSLDASDDEDSAVLVGTRLKKVGLGLGQLRLSLEGRRRVVGRNFRSFNRIRPVEFGRRWNLGRLSTGVAGGNAAGSDETTNEIEGALHLSESSTASGEWGTISLGDQFDASRWSARLVVDEEGWPRLSYEVEDITSTDLSAAERGNWLRQTARVRYPRLVAALTPAIELEHEDRRQRSTATDSLLAESLSFMEVRPSITWGGDQLELGSSLDYRKEQFVLDDALRNAATGWTARVFFKYRTGGLFSTAGNVGFRRRRFREVFRIEQARQNAESVVIRWNGSYQPFDRAIMTSWFYEAQTERTPRLQEIYVRTGPELGQYVWRDDNNDGAIQIDEFVPETTPNEGTYVKTFIPSDTLFSVIGVQARIRVSLDPARKWRESAGWRRALSQVTTRTTLEVAEKSREQDLSQIYLLNLRRFRKPGSTLNGRLAIRQDVLLFRGRPNFGIDLSFNQIRALTDLAAGLEERLLTGWRVEGRVRPIRLVSVSVAASTEVNRVESESFVSREFDLLTRRLSPEITLSPSRSWQLKLSVEVADKTDRRFDRTARLLKIPFEVRFNQARRLQLTGRVEVADVGLTGESVGAAQFELTDGRGPGTSALWSIGAQYAINRFIRATFAYDGRAPANAPTLHTLRMQVSAIF